MTRLKVGERVCFNRRLLQEAKVVASDPIWRIHGVVVGVFPSQYVRVKFDGEEAPRTVPEDRLVKASM